MASTYTTNLGIEKIATGEQSGTWGNTTNTNFDIIDQAINGIASVTLASAGSSGSPNSLDIDNGLISDGRNAFIEFVDGGDLGGTAYVQLTPSDAEKIVIVRNSLSGDRSILLFQGTYNASNDLEVPNGIDMMVKFDGGGVSATVTQVFDYLRVGGLLIDNLFIANGNSVSLFYGGSARLATASSGTTISGDLDVTGNINASLGSLDAINGTFTGNVGAVNATFTGNVSGLAGTFTGNVSGLAGTFTGNVSGVNATFTGIETAVAHRETVYSLTGTDINPANGGIQYKTLSGATTFTESLSDGDSVVLRIAGGDTYAITWPTMTWVTAVGDVAPSPLNGNDVFVLWQDNSVVYGAYVGKF